MIEVDVDHALEASGEKALEAITQLVLRQYQFEKLNSACAEGLVNLQVYYTCQCQLVPASKDVPS